MMRAMDTATRQLLDHARDAYGSANAAVLGDLVERMAAALARSDATIVQQASEIATLRREVSELTSELARCRQRIVDLASSLAKRDGELTEAHLQAGER